MEEKRIIKSEVIAQAADQIAQIIEALPYSEEWNRYCSYDFEGQLKDMISDTDITIE